MKLLGWLLFDIELNLLHVFVVTLAVITRKLRALKGP